MTRDLRWRIIALQVVVLLILTFGAGPALYAANFTHGPIRAPLEPQQIKFPPAGDRLPANLSQYAGQQVLNGDQAHAYADSYIGLHLAALGPEGEKGKPYSYWSTIARTAKDPAKQAEASELVTTIFRGETLRAILNQAWAFWVVGDIANYVGIGLAVAALVVLGSLIFELFFAPKRAEQAAGARSMAASAS